jgi:uncharacterized iron-regulated membrane protein
MSRRIRTVLFWLHLSAGVTAGLVILVMSATGVLLMYERQILEWAERGYRSAPPNPSATRLPIETLLGRAAEEGFRPASLTLQSDPAAPAAISIGRGRSLFLNPYTGESLGEGARRTRAFFRAVTDFHRWLGAGEENRRAARAVTGACNLAFLFLVITGPYLWIPRIRNRRQVRNVAWFRRGLLGKARDFNWHNVIGLWTAVPLFLVVVTAATLSYPWASNLLYRLVGEEPPPARSGAGGGPERPRGAGGEEESVSLEGLGELWAMAETRVPGWKSLSLRLPEDPQAPVTFTILRGQRGRPDLRAQLTLERTGEVESWEPYSQQSPGRRLRSWARWIHTGEAGGVIGQTVAGAAAGGAAMLVWTGLALAWRRFFSRKRAPQAAAAPARTSFLGAEEKS